MSGYRRLAVGIVALMENQEKTTTFAVFARRSLATSLNLY